MKRIATIVLLFATTAMQSMADGVMFWHEKIPPTIPYQRALILFDEGTETLILQSKYEIPGGNGTPSIGWVVPVPAEPEVASMPADMAYELFRGLSATTPPYIIRIVPTLFTVLLVLSLLTLFLCMASETVRYHDWINSRNALRCLFICVVYFLVRIGLRPLGISQGVDIIAEHRVGIYDVSVVRSDEAGALIDWLNKNDFKFTERDAEVIDSYISKGWCFVVAIIHPDVGQDEGTIVSEGLAAPLILRFPHPDPIYPLALTGTGGYETEVLIYLASSTKMTTDDRLKLRYAGEMTDWPLTVLWSTDYEPTGIEPEGFFDPEKMNYPYLCKFRDKLTPKQMGTDIVFSEADNEKPYRETIVRW